MPISISLPVSDSDVRKLHVGDEVLVSGTMITGRDAAHKYLVKNDDPEVRRVSKDSFIYHCGPVIQQDAKTKAYKFIAAGPTTSIREEPYQADVIARYGVRGVIGKGGMGPRTLAALQKHGAVYLHAIGGLAVVLAQCVTKVSGVLKLEEFGVPEAMWIIEVRDFPSVITMDAHGKSLHQIMNDDSAAKARALMERGGE